MEARKMRQFGQVSGAALALVLLSTPAFAQEGGGGGLNLLDMFASMGPTAASFFFLSSTPIRRMQ